MNAQSWEYPNAGPAIDLTCSKCVADGEGTYELPADARGCGDDGAVSSRGA